MYREETRSGWEDFGFLLETVLLPSRIAFQSVHSLVVESDDDGFGCGAIQGQISDFSLGGNETS